MSSGSPGTSPTELEESARICSTPEPPALSLHFLGWCLFNTTSANSFPAWPEAEVCIGDHGAQSCSHGLRRPMPPRRTMLTALMDARQVQCSTFSTNFMHGHSVVVNHRGSRLDVSGVWCVRLHLCKRHHSLHSVSHILQRQYLVSLEFVG